MFRVCLAVSLLPVLACAEPKFVSEQDARRLVRAALPTWALKAGPVYIRPWKSSPNADFFFFTADRDNPGGSGTVGHFAVERTTGDVWDGVVCQEYKVEGLARLQVLIRKKLGLTETTYKNLKRQGPYCDGAK